MLFLHMFLRLGNQLVDLSHPQVMAIINITPDSFVPTCHCVTEVAALKAAATARQEGAAILDIGACSTRPGAVPIDEAGEWKRLQPALRAIRNAFPDAMISVDTFRAEIARKAIELYGVNMINDISGGSEEMYHVVAEKKVAYILTYNEQETIGTLKKGDIVVRCLDFLVRRADRLHRLGVSDVIADPGFGFNKTLEQNYELLTNLRMLQPAGLPLLVGISRKSMIYKPLNISPEEALNGTTVLHTIALQGGAAILRVHDVKETKQVIELCSYCC